MARGKNWGLSALLQLLLLIMFAVGWAVMQRRDRVAAMENSSHEASLNVSSADFSDGGSIPDKFACSGVNISPAISISAPPNGTKSLVILMDDPDAPHGGFIHWVVYNAPPWLRQLPEGASGNLGGMQGALQGVNNFENVGYGGPCPPVGSPHHYIFRVFALDTILQLAPGATRKQVTRAAEEHVLAEGKLVGLYSRGE